jgi:hypothetical protein
MRIAIVAIVVTCIFYLPSIAQRTSLNSKDERILQNISLIKLRLGSGSKPGSIIYPFSKVTFYDVRYDTTHIALYAEASAMIVPIFKNYKIDMEGGVASSFSTYMNHQVRCDSSAQQEVVCFIKNLRVLRKDTMVEHVSAIKTIGQVKLTAEVFYKVNNLYFPACRIDTVLVNEVGVVRKEIGSNIKEHLLVPMLELVKSKITSTDWAMVKTRRAYTDSTVLGNYYTRRFQWPVLTQPTFKKGLYLTFEEFKLNNPSVANFVVRRDKNNTISILDDKGNYINTNTIFGFSDGVSPWILRRNFGYPLLRAGNSFEFFWTVTDYYKILLALDMETGELM